MKFTPLGDRILVELENIADRKVGAIFVPDSGPELLRAAKVVAVGEANTAFAIGDRILFHAFSGVNVHCPSLGIVNDNKLRFLMPSEVLAKVGE